MGIINILAEATDAGNIPADINWGQGFFNLGRGIFENTTSPINHQLIKME